MYPGVVFVLMGQTYEAGHTSPVPLMTFENLAGYRESRLGLKALVLVLPEQAGSSALDEVRQCHLPQSCGHLTRVLSPHPLRMTENCLCIFRITSHCRWMITQQQNKEVCVCVFVC